MSLSDDVLHELTRVTDRSPMAEVFARTVLGGRVSVPAAQEAIASARELPVLRHGHDLLLDRALELRDSVSAYDGVYVALAEILGATRVTGDRRLSRAAGDRCAVAVVG
jgi:predicted nucleic acid-binding protein